MIGLVAAYRKRQIQEHAAVGLALQLIFGARHLHLRVVEHVGLLVAERHDAGIHLIADVEKHIDERHLIGCDVADKLAVALVFRRIGRIDDLRRLIIEPCELCKLARSQFVCQLVTVERVDIGKAHRVVDLVVAFEFL